MLQLLRPETDAAEWWQRFYDKELCCLDRGCGRVIRNKCTKEQVQGNSDLLNCLRSHDADDSSVTVVEVERQHGRMRIGHASNKSGLAYTASDAFLKDWTLEHKSPAL